jgi:hypothetical protein
MLARRNAAPAPAAFYAAGWRHGRELAQFEAIMRLIDQPQIRPPAEEEEAREPMFFSENVAGIGRALRRLDTATVVIHDRGAAVREDVVYRMTQ